MTQFADVFGRYFILGYNHVIPYGFDHVLFILSIFFLNSKVRPVIIQCTVFTLAHSVSLGLAAADYIQISSAVIEPLIALSIVFTALENVMHDEVKPWRLGVIFCFGLIHGLGFAGALKEAGIPQGQFLSSLVAFNTGVEAGQVSVILVAYWLCAHWFSQRSWYKKFLVYPVSAGIACIALYWTIERIFMF